MLVIVIGLKKWRIYPPHSQNSARGMDNMSRIDDEEQE